MPKYAGPLVTSVNYSLFSKEARVNAHRELEAYLKGRPFYKAIISVEEDGETKRKTVIKEVRTTR